MKLVIFGGGDLAQRVIGALQVARTVRDILVVTENDAGQLARLYDSCGTANVRGGKVNWIDEGDVTRLLTRERPDLIFHASAFISPWLGQSGRTRSQERLSAAGFGIMLPAQLPKIRVVMLAVRSLDLHCPVINASYPDLTHPVLHTEGLAPTIGVGNAGMIFNCIARDMRSTGIHARARLLAHHAQVTPFARRENYHPGEPPWLFLEEETMNVDELLKDRLPGGRLLNALTAAHTIEIISALAEEGSGLRTSAPGPLGLPGGWPIRVSHRGIELDLPISVSVQQGIDYQFRAGVADGVARIDPDGTVHYTDAARDTLASTAPGLTEPFHARDLRPRLAELQKFAHS